MVKPLLHTCLFGLGMAGVAAGLGRLDTIPFWSWSIDKIQHLRSRPADYDTVFLGSSRIHYGLQPEVFDAAMREQGTSTRSFNAALSGLRTHDTLRLGEWLLAEPPPSLRRLIVELHDFDQSIRGEQWLSDQELEMHPPSLLACRLQSLWVSRQPAGQRLGQLGYLLLHTLGNALHVGQGPRIVADRLAIAQGRTPQRGRPVANGGWSAVDAVQLPHMVAQHEAFVRSPEVFEERLRNRIAEPIPDWSRGGFRADAIAAFAALAASRGIETVFVVMPTMTTDFRGRDQVQELHGKARVLAFDNPLQHRSIYDPAHFHDPSHLSTAGAAWFSRRLAANLADAPAAPDLLSAEPIEVTVDRDPMRPDTVTCRAANLPFLGDALVMVARSQGSTPLGGSLALGLAMPIAAQTRLQRSGTRTATGNLQGDDLAGDGPWFAQLGVLHAGVVIALSPVVEFRGPN
jgi:hypothetical protein